MSVGLACTALACSTSASVPGLPRRLAMRRARRNPRVRVAPGGSGPIRTCGWPSPPANASSTVLDMDGLGSPEVVYRQESGGMAEESVLRMNTRVPGWTPASMSVGTVPI